MNKPYSIIFNFVDIHGVLMVSRPRQLTYSQFNFIAAHGNISTAALPGKYFTVTNVTMSTKFTGVATALIEGEVFDIEESQNGC